MTDPLVKSERGTIAVIGIGYVGLPLSIAFGKVRETIGFDVNQQRIDQLASGVDVTKEVSSGELASAKDLYFTSDPELLREATIFVIAVPTPINAHKQPDLGPILGATRTVAGLLKPGDLVVYESTVYPGATEEDCVPVLERVSGLTFNIDFHCGYSPERINPGDRKHRLPDVIKVTSGSTPEAAEKVDALYAEIIAAGTFKAESIRVAEAAKVIENTQRDLNIALVNELAMIFNKLGLDTEAVLQAARTKWNFLPFRPGLVGGHCIGVDPYYLTHKAEAIGYHPQVILAGRRINDGMGTYVASQMVKAMLGKRIQVRGARVLVMGVTFKENCSDLRNTRVVGLVSELEEYGVAVDVHDPLADPATALDEYGIDLVVSPAGGKYDGIIVAVAHRVFEDMRGGSVRNLGAETCVIYDLKNVLDREDSDLRL